MTGREPEPYTSGDAWLTRLPGLADESLAQWDLSPDGDPRHGMAPGCRGAGVMVTDTGRDTV